MIDETAGPPTATLRLPFQPPLDAGLLLDFLGSRAVAGLEGCDGGTYRRSLRLPGGTATVALTPGDDHVECAIRLAGVAGLGGDVGDGPGASAVEEAVALCRRILDLDADIGAIDSHLGADPLLAPAVRAHPGLRVPSHVDGFEVLVRAIVGQQVSVAGARTVLGRLAAALGEPLPHPDGPVTTGFPRPEALATAPDELFPMPRSRADTLRRVADAVASGELAIDRSVDRAELRSQLLAMPGVGPWTVAYVELRALGDPDVFLPTDLGVRRALEAHGLPGDPRSAAALAERWRPWRSYALLHLWTGPMPAT